ncbi:MAG: TonB-dependent receptor [Pseudomonadota bacterium]
MKSKKSVWLGAVSALAAGSTFVADVALAQADDEIVVSIGTRRAERSASDAVAPIDVIPPEDFTNQGTNDIAELLRTAVPSYNINTQPISDAATLIRPANLRGLSPDNTLVLLNGKRRHRGSVISVLGGGIADGAQGPDVSVIPALALKQVEVLRDGASSQYGSDAIAGVINFVLKDSAEGGMVEALWGQTYEGDGDQFRIAGNVGLPLGEKGFINLTGEYSEVDGTVRSIVRDDVNALIAAGNTDVTDFKTINSYTNEVPQYWGQPDVEDNYKLFFNSAYEVTENAELYAFGNYAERTTAGGFFFRNPTNRGGVYRGPTVDAITGLEDENGVASILVGDLDGVGTGGACPAGIPLTGTDGLIADPTILAQVEADPNCFSFVETIPSGFVPRFGGDVTDYSIAGGIRGEFPVGAGLAYDVSVVHGSSDSDFFINNTINASLGPDTPRDFDPGGYKQTETIVDAGFNYSLPVSAFASDLNVAFGAQYRQEEFEITAGDDASFALGPLADQGFSSSSNGFGGFTSSSTNDQSAYSFYLDLEADVTEDLTVQAAVRYEDYEEFDTTTDYKIGLRYQVTPFLFLRGTVSTGFHAPTAGQANVTNVTTQIVNGELVDQGTLPLTTAAGQLAADFIASQGNGRPELGTEESQNYTIGAGFDLGPSTWTIDYFNIDVDDRIALSANVDFLEALNWVADQNGISDFTSVSAALTGLDSAGVINRSDFAGFEDLLEFRYFANSFDTTTEGVEIVGTVPLEFIPRGSTTATVAFAWIDTQVDDRGSINPIGDGRVAALEEQLPELKGNVTLTHVEENWRFLFRANYFGEWEDTNNGTGEQGEEVNFDIEVAYTAFDGLEFAVGANNVFDNYPEENPDAGDFGQLYPDSSPSGFNGGSYYLRARYSW